MSTFNPNVPQDGQPLDNLTIFTQNWLALDTSYAKDHTLFSDPTSSTNGHHRQVFYNAPLAAPLPVPTGTQACAWPKASVAPAPVGITQAVFQNASTPALYLLSCVKAWGTVTAAGVLQDGFNVTAAGGLGIYTVSFSTALPNANYAVLATCQMANTLTTGGIIGVDAKATTGFQVNIRALGGAFGAPVPFSFVVLQT